MSDWFKKWFSSDEYLSVYSHRNIEDAENLLSLILNNVNIPENAKMVLDLFKQINNESKITIVVVTHDARMARETQKIFRID